MTICSTAPASRPQGRGQCGTIRAGLNRAPCAARSPFRAGQTLGFGPDLGPDGLGLGWQVQRHAPGHTGPSKRGDVLGIGRGTENGVQDSGLAAGTGAHRAPR